MERVATQRPKRTDTGQRSLAWLTFATRPLTVLELQYGLTSTNVGTEVSPNNLAKVEDILSTSSGLAVLVHENGVSCIRLVHHTAGRSLKRRLRDVEQDTGFMCTHYLSSSKFESGACQNDEEFAERLRPNLLYEDAT